MTIKQTDLAEAYRDEFTGKTAVVTGGTSGIGRATALHFARAGANVVIAGRREAEGSAMLEELRDAGGTALFVRADISRANDVKALIAAAVEAFGGIDMACNSAGVEGAPALIADTDEAEWDLVTGINLKGTWLCLKHLVKPMLERGGGAIVNIASVGGQIGKAESAPYVASKHGVVGLTKTAALEYATRNIRVNAICPGVINGPMPERIFADPAVKKAVVGLHPMGRIGEPVEIAEAVLWLCSQRSGFMTGQSMIIDGGMLAGITALGDTQMR